MPLGEFELIDRFFRSCGAARGDVRLSVGDDAALIDCPAGRDLVAAIDTLVEGVHFPAGSPAASIGHRALAVNLSDMAAMGAEPAWALLALTLPRADECWLAEFSRGLDALARSFGVAIVGGDTTSGPLTASLQILGTVERGTALTRAGGSAGDVLFVSGTPGDAAAGLGIEQARLSVADAEAARELAERFLFRRRESRSGGGCAGSPAPASTCPMACSVTLASSRVQAVAERSCIMTNCRYRARSLSRWAMSARASWLSQAVMITSCCSACPPVASMRCSPLCRPRNGAMRASACCAASPARSSCAAGL